MNRVAKAAFAVYVALLASSACGGAPPPPPASAAVGAEVAAPRARHASTGLGVENEIGALDEAKMNAAFARASRSLGACFLKRLADVPYLGGDVRFKLRIATTGEVRWAFVKDSTLGDRSTEACMLGALRAVTWPKPLGGDGLAESSLTLAPSDDEHPPVAWSEAELGAALEGARGDLSRCRTNAGAGALKATVYVEPGGRPSSVGVSCADEKGESAATCVVDTLKALTFPSPGAHASKVSFTIQ